MRQTIIKFLRGDYNSVRHRFLVLPWQWLHYFTAYRLFGKGWTEFYADRMNQEVAKGGGNRPSDRYLDGGQRHLDFLTEHGLLPHHSMLDYGCGVLRTGRYVIPYLTDGKYVGVDIADARIEKGRGLLAEDSVAPDTYEAFVVSSCDLHELEGYCFDYVWAESVLTHMPLMEIRTMLRAMRAHLTTGGQFFFTYSESNEYARRNVKDFWYPGATMAQECRAAGYQFELIELPDSGYSRMVRLTVPSGADSEGGAP